MNLIKIGNRIKSLREESKLTQIKIAEYLSLDKCIIIKIENGEVDTTSDVIEKISTLFCCPINYILFGKEYKQKFLFNLNDLTSEEIKSLASINKIVLNQCEIDKMLAQY